MPRIELGTFCVLDRCDNHYTTLTGIKNVLCVTTIEVLFGLQINKFDVRL